MYHSAIQSMVKPSAGLVIRLGTSLVIIASASQQKPILSALMVYTLLIYHYEALRINKIKFCFFLEILFVRGESSETSHSADGDN